MHKKTFHLVITLIIAIVFVVQPAQAQGSQPPQFDGTIIGPNGETYYVDEFFSETKAKQSSLSGFQALAVNCKSATWGVNIYDGVGVLIIRYQQKVDWCYDGTKITSVSHIKTPTVYRPIYKYNGLIGHIHSGGVNQSSYRAYSQASFCMFAPPATACIWYVYPWVDMTVHGNGTVSGSAGY